ncbi:DNA gyrase subunit A [Myxococcus sp. CA051A]|nr:MULTISPECIES: DNA gyrase subunit A [Myxococcus]NTX06459.1 DNA gyrase subunit A [Myxococcus sp. CA040A]NTX09716.1 DNA gyrase subunit A [Myxococcus sp. CA056]NTX35076.1 DNA gyrase subunit A [Myxococcus sp. CA033]NTX54178.1 DNA gyrase subunit A [Myxococcus sp. CA039A]NTX65043.1 DNA gyrase subunit A [Myxococcus sp. CA051A]
MADDTTDKPAPPSPPPPPDGAGELIPVNIEDEMRRSYLDYSMSVIIGRALPDVRDGLKPVHRRVLFAMNDLSNYHNRPYKKSARVVGDVIGKYHPHGDSSVYDAMVRLAQPWSLRYLLVDGQGNFGSVDGDMPAAMRYTEARMDRLAEELLADIDKETVEFGANYDDSLQEPLVLPARFPNLLVNGSSGIAVGMTTNIPPHNMTEVISGTLHLIDHPTCTVRDLMEFITGPDFPTGAFITGREGIHRAYETGRGQITVRARSEIETSKKGDREAIIFTEIPYQVNKARLIEKIAELVREKKLEGISDIRDESDRQGMRIVIELKRDAISQVVLNNLYASTALETTFGAVMLAIDGGQPRTLNLKEMLDRFVAHRRDVVTRRSRYELRKAMARMHIVEGLLVAQDLIDLVVSLIRASRDPDEARWGLMNILSPTLYEHERFANLQRIDYAKAKAQMEMLVSRARNEEPAYQGLAHKYEGAGFSQEQAQNILEMRLQRLTGLQREELFRELIALVRDVARLQDILANELSLLTVIKTELMEIRERYGDKRRTEIIGAVDDMTSEDLIAEETMVVTLSHTGYVKRSPLSEYRAQKRGGRGKTGAATKEDDFVSKLFVASTHAYLMPITTKGKLYSLKVHQIPQASRTSRGKAMVNLVQFGEGERLAQVLVTRDFPENRYVFFVTKKGVVKRTDLSAFDNVRSSGIIALGIDEGDELVAVMITDGTKDILLSTASGMSIRFPETEVRSMGRQAFGVKGITLDETDEVVGADVVENDSAILTVTENGYGKRTEESEYRQQGRGGKGIIDIKATERNGKVVGLLQVKESDEVMLVTNGGMLIRMKVREISVIGRNTQGVRLIALENDQEKVMALSKLPEGEESEEETTPPAEVAGATDVAAEPSASEPAASEPEEPTEAPVADEGGGSEEPQA